MTDDDIKRLWGRDAVPAWWADTLPRFRAIVEAAEKEGAEEERDACAAIADAVNQEAYDTYAASDTHMTEDDCLSYVCSAATEIADKIRSRAAVQSAAEGEGGVK